MWNTGECAGMWPMTNLVAWAISFVQTVTCQFPGASKGSPIDYPTFTTIDGSPLHTPNRSPCAKAIDCISLGLKVQCVNEHCPCSAMKTSSWCSNRVPRRYLTTGPGFESSSESRKVCSSTILAQDTASGAYCAQHPLPTDKHSKASLKLFEYS